MSDIFSLTFSLSIVFIFIYGFVLLFLFDLFDFLRVKFSEHIKNLFKRRSDK